MMLAEMAMEAGLPKGVLNVIHGAHEAVNFICDAPQVRAISFVGGDMAGYAIGENLMRGKDALSGGKGQTPYEKMSTQQQEDYAKMLRQQILTEYGIVPGTREQYAMDPNTGMGVS